MGLFLDVLTLPVLGAPRLVHFVAGKIVEAAEQELLDEDSVLEQLLELQERHEAGELTEDELAREEEALLDMLKTIREAKETKEQRRRVA